MTEIPVFKKIDKVIEKINKEKLEKMEVARDIDEILYGLLKKISDNYMNDICLVDDELTVKVNRSEKLYNIFLSFRDVSIMERNNANVDLPILTLQGALDALKKDTVTIKSIR